MKNFWEAMFECDHVVFRREHLQRGFGFVRLLAGVPDPEVPVVVGIVLPPIGLLFREGLLEDPVGRAVVGVSASSARPTITPSPKSLSLDYLARLR